METRFTPGPWYKTEISKEYGCSAFSIRPCNKWELEIAQTNNSSEKQQANAALISASPELYAALEKLIAVCQHEDVLIHVKGHVALGITALKKARDEDA